MGKRGEIVIQQDNAQGGVTYWLARGPQSLADRAGISLAPYIHALYGFLRQKQAKKILLIGCGGGTLATMLAKTRAKVTMLDIDPLSFELARRYFHLPASIACRVADGAKFLRTGDERYDAIVLDAFDESAVPPHLLRASFFKLVKARLKPGGIFLVNIIVADDEDHRADRAGFRLKKIFSRVRVYDAEGELDRNAILLAGSVTRLKRARLLLNPRQQRKAIAAEMKAFDFRHLVV